MDEEARKTAGELYSKKTMQAIRYALQRHFESTRKIDIINSSEFKRSNKVFKAFLEKLKKKGKGHIKRHTPKSKADLQLMQNSLDLDTPVGLQRKVFMDIMIYFANRRRENVREMTREDFELNTEENCRRFFSLKDKMTKNQRDDDDEQSQAGLMYEFQAIRDALLQAC